jgi:hypothetical protein
MRSRSMALIVVRDTGPKGPWASAASWSWLRFCRSRAERNSSPRVRPTVFLAWCALRGSPATGFGWRVDRFRSGLRPDALGALPATPSPPCIRTVERGRAYSAAMARVKPPGGPPGGRAEHAPVPSRLGGERAREVTMEASAKKVVGLLLLACLAATPAWAWNCPEGTSTRFG